MSNFTLGRIYSKLAAIDKKEASIKRAKDKLIKESVKRARFLMGKITQFTIKKTHVYCIDESYTRYECIDLATNIKKTFNISDMLDLANFKEYFFFQENNNQKQKELMILQEVGNIMVVVYQLGYDGIIFDATGESYNVEEDHFDSMWEDRLNR